MMTSLLSLMLIVAAGFIGTLLLVGAVLLLLTIKVGSALTRNGRGLLPVLVLVALAFVAVRGLRHAHHLTHRPAPPHRHLHAPPAPHSPVAKSPAIRSAPPVELLNGDETLFLNEEQEDTSVQNQRVPVASSTGEVPTSVLEQTRNASGQIERVRKSKELPQWAAQTPHAGGPRPLSVVVHSQRFATLEEAESQIRQLTANLVFERLQLQVPKLRRWTPTLPDLEEFGLVRRSGIVNWPVTVGEFEETVTQIYWQLNFSPAVEQRLAAAVKEQTVKVRLTALFGLIGVGAVVMAVGSRILLRQKEHV